MRKLGKKAVWCSVIGMGMAIGAILWWTRVEPEPAHAGQSLTEWLELLNSGGVASQVRAEEAISAMGDSVLPRLKRMLEIRDGPLRIRVIKALKKLGLPSKSASEIHALAMAGIPVLGAEAAVLIPRISEQLMENTPGGRRAGECLRSMWPLSKDALIGALGSTNDIVRTHAVRNIERVRDESITPYLTPLLNDSKEGIRIAALRAMLDLNTDPAIAMPCFTQGLNDPSAKVRLTTVNAFYSWKGNPRDVVTIGSVLRRLIRSDPSEQVRQRAEYAVDALQDKLYRMRSEIDWRGAGRESR